MKTMTKLVALISVFGLWSCMRVVNHFVVLDPGKTASSAELQLCGKKLNLARSKGGFAGDYPVTCEDDGRIVVILPDGQESYCRVEYPTPALERYWEYEIKGKECQEIEYQPSAPGLNKFVILDPNLEISSAELMLCGTRLKLTKSKGQFSGELARTCEGIGSISVSFVDGQATSCTTDQIDPSLVSYNEYKTVNGVCVGTRYKIGRAIKDREIQ
jgi:hypothetical protein